MEFEPHNELLVFLCHISIRHECSLYSGVQDLSVVGSLNYTLADCDGRLDGTGSGTAVLPSIMAKGRAVAGVDYPDIPMPMKTNISFR